MPQAIRLLLAGMLGLGLAHVGGPARAAPQVLALVATEAPVRLACDGAACAAELSAFCLQPGRAIPAAGTAYLPTGGDGVRLVGITPDGRRISLDAARLLRFRAVRGFAAVRVAIAAEEVAALGLGSVALQIGAGVSLLPRPVAGDPAPQSPAELARAISVQRDLGSGVVDRDAGRMAAARVLGRMVNRLPAVGRVDGETRARLWDETAPAGLGETAATILRYRHDYCQWIARSGRFETLRDCLASQHDSLMESLANDYRAALEAGS